MNILVVDDDATSRFVATATLRTLGHDCTVVADGAAAWDAIGDTQPDVVISDWLMPGLTGLELCQLVRRQEDQPYIYFILVTGQETAQQVVDGMTAGADDYLLKPLKLADLQARLIAASRVTAVHRQLADQRVELERLNLHLNGLARSDPLTGLHNRLALEEDLHTIEARVERYHHSYCVSLIDVDHFKAYNDMYGHVAGDRALRAVASELKTRSRGGDSVYRYGGEEFLCVLPEQTLSQATIALERIRFGIQDLALPHDGNPPFGVVTVSAGLTLLDPDRHRPMDETLKEADDALYRAKQLGRNRVECGPPAFAPSGDEAAASGALDDNGARAELS
jgi:two-component system, cell cycle response regulator